MSVLTIAMDGPVGAGKSTIADAVARELGILHLDTGAMYRACGLCCLRAGADLQDENACRLAIENAEISVECVPGGQRTLLDGEDVSGLIRTEEVSMAASTVARYASVRRQMVRLQQKLAESQPMLVDGRDICVRVLPNAPLKIYLTASAEERAMRRYRQLLEKGAEASYDQVLQDLKARDAQDMNREVDPLRPAQGAVIIDTTGMTFDESVSRIVSLARSV